MLILKLSHWHVTILLGCTIISHGLILFDNGVYWDGWIIRGWFRQRDFAAFRTSTSQIGLPIYYYFQRFMAMLPNVIFCYKLLSFICMFLSSLLIYCLCRESGCFADIQSLCISLLFLCYPANHMMIEPSCMQYGLMHTIFLGACYLGILAECMLGPDQWIMRCAAIFLFLVSFNMNSLLVYYTGFILLLLLHGLGNKDCTIIDAIQYILWRGYYLLLPFIYWVWKQKYAVSHEFYSDYNLIWFNLRRIAGSYIQLLMTGAGGLFIQSLIFIAKQPLKWVLSIVIAASVIIFLLSSSGLFMGISIIPEKQAYLIMLFGSILLMCASIPYILVGQRFGSRGFETKNNIILALPMSLIIFGGCHIILKPVVIPYFLGAIFTIGVIYLNYNYLCLQSVYAKNLSLLNNLGKVPSAKEKVIFLIYDAHSIRFLSIDQPEHRSPYLIYMFEWLWGDVSRFGVNESYARSTAYSPEEIKTAIIATTIPYALQGIDPYGKQALVIIRDGKKSCVGEVKTAVKYLYHRFLKRNKLEEFLSCITQVDLFPIQTLEQEKQCRKP